MATYGFCDELHRILSGVAVAIAVLVQLPRVAEAQVVGGCQPTQYLDRTAAGADREILWDFGVESDPEHCLEVEVGQTVLWNRDLDNHPLAGDVPNPITFHDNGSVTFNAPGTFGFVCLSHSSMQGAIRVVASGPPPAAAVPSLAPLPTFVLSMLLLSGGLYRLRPNARRSGC